MNRTRMEHLFLCGFFAPHTLKGEMHMKCVQRLFLTSQAKGHDGSVPLLCLSQGQLQTPDAEI